MLDDSDDIVITPLPEADPCAKVRQELEDVARSLALHECVMARASELTQQARELIRQLDALLKPVGQ